MDSGVGVYSDVQEGNQLVSTPPGEQYKSQFISVNFSFIFTLVVFVLTFLSYTILIQNVHVLAGPGSVWLQSVCSISKTLTVSVSRLPHVCVVNCNISSLNVLANSQKLDLRLEISPQRLTGMIRCLSQNSSYLPACSFCLEEIFDRLVSVGGGRLNGGDGCRVLCCGNRSWWGRKGHMLMERAALNNISSASGVIQEQTGVQRTDPE